MSIDGEEGKMFSLQPSPLDLALTIYTMPIIFCVIKFYRYTLKWLSNKHEYLHIKLKKKQWIHIF